MSCPYNVLPTSIIPIKDQYHKDKSPQTNKNIVTKTNLENPQTNKDIITKTKLEGHRQMRILSKTK